MIQWFSTLVEHGFNGYWLILLTNKKTVKNETVYVVKIDIFHVLKILLELFNDLIE